MIRVYNEIDTMVYSKLQQQKTFQLQIDYKSIKCPVCHRKGKYHPHNEDLECECGYIIQTPHKYVAGKRINTNHNYIIIRRKKND